MALLLATACATLPAPLGSDRIAALLADPARYLERKASAGSRTQADYTALALARRAQQDVADAARRMNAK